VLARDATNRDNVCKAVYWETGMRFSERFGFKPVRQAIQIQSMDSELRNSLWNVLHVLFLRIPEDAYSLRVVPVLWTLAHISQADFFKRPLDELEDAASAFVKRLKNWFMSAECHEVYDFLEFVRQIDGGLFEESDRLTVYGKKLNTVLEQEKSGYRFIGNLLAPVIAEHEVESVERSLNLPDRFAGARAHIAAALQMYANRKAPDYRNAVKEAISAIESAACVIANDSNASLGSALKTVERDHEIHSAMREAFIKLYGYTSDAGGIRHAMLEEGTVEEHEARFMLIACSAFLNYLVSSTT
jgi:hypothetical protein